LWASQISLSDALGAAISFPETRSSYWVLDQASEVSGTPQACF